MKLTFLGTGDAFGSGGRLQTCILAETAEVNFLIDCGASSQVAIRKNNIEPNNIRMICLTHLHGDHFGGVPFFILDAQMISKRTTPLTIIGPVGTKERITRAMEVLFPRSSKVQRNFTIDIVEMEVGMERSFTGLSVQSFEMVHPSGNISTALRFQAENKIIAYTGDTEWNDNLAAVVSGADLLIAEAYTYDKKIKFHLDYITLIENVSQLNIKQIILTHMGIDMLKSLNHITCLAASDGMSIEV